MTKNNSSEKSSSANLDRTPAEKLQGIRLVVSDLDGTLFSSSLTLPETLPETIARLGDNGILFATASGRNWASQKVFFPQLLDKITFICDNGAFIVQKQEPVFISRLSPDLWKSIVRKCHAYGDECRAILCGVNGTYVADYHCSPKLQNVIDHFYIGLNATSDLCKIQDEIFKVSICYLPGTGGPFYEDFHSAYGSQANVLRTAECFMDIMNTGISKAGGVRFLQSQYGISPEETVTFGDFENDISLFSQSKHSFLMENAPAHMRQYAKYTAPSNDNNGVIRTIEDYIL